MNFYPINLFLQDVETDEAVRIIEKPSYDELQKRYELLVNEAKTTDRCIMTCCQKKTNTTIFKLQKVKRGLPLTKEELDYLPPLSETVEFVEKHNNTISITRSKS